MAIVDVCPSCGAQKKGGDASGSPACECGGFMTSMLGHVGEDAVFPPPHDATEDSSGTRHYYQFKCCSLQGCSTCWEDPVWLVGAEKL